MWEMDYDYAASYWCEKDKEAQMGRHALRDKIDEFIKAHTTCALATASEAVRCTPIEYNYMDGYFYLFSEGGMKFRNLKTNRQVAIAIFESYQGFGKLKGLQVSGDASMVEPFTEEYCKVLQLKKIPLEAMKGLPHPMNLIKIVPTSMDYLDSELKEKGFNSRQHWEA